MGQGAGLMVCCDSREFRERVRDRHQNPPRLSLPPLGLPHIRNQGLKESSEWIKKHLKTLTMFHTEQS